MGTENREQGTAIDWEQLNWEQGTGKNLFPLLVLKTSGTGNLELEKD
jgi:hypothetical protein